MTQPSPQDLQRRKIRVNGGETVVDVATVVFKDKRLAPLLCDLNPSLPSTGPLAAGAVVTCPSKLEAMAFAKKMGFSLGFDEKAANGTKQKRAWQKMQGPGQASHAGIDPVDAARRLLDQKLTPAEVGKRLAKLATPDALEAFLQTPQTEPPLQTVQKAVELHVSYPRAHGAIGAAIGIVDATLRPTGLLALMQALAADKDAGAAAMAALLVPTPAREVFAQRAADVARFVARANELAKIERGARDATLAVDKDAVVLQALIAAVVDRVDILAGDRLKLLGLAEAWALTATHLLKLKEMLKKHDELLPRSGSEVLKTLGNARDGSKLPKPWPVIAAVVKGLAPLTEAVPVDARDAGVGGLVLAGIAAAKAPAPPVEASTSGMVRPPQGVLSAAAMQARAASGARAIDEGTAIAERLAPHVVALVDLVRPIAGDAGPSALRRAKRRSFYESLVLGTSAPQGDAIAKLVDDIFADARRTGFSGVDKVQKAQQQAAREVAKSITQTLSVNQKNASELGRALLVVVMTLDRELGGLLLRATGKEAFRAHVEKHGGKLLSKAALVYSEPPA